MRKFATWCFCAYEKLTELPENSLPVLNFEGGKKYLPLQTLPLEIQQKHVGNAQKHQQDSLTPFPQTSALTLMCTISKHFEGFVQFTDTGVK